MYRIGGGGRGRGGEETQQRELFFPPFYCLVPESMAQATHSRDAHATPVGTPFSWVLPLPKLTLFAKMSRECGSAVGTPPLSKRGFYCQWPISEEPQAFSK